ncbi:CopG family transcriptional regulator [Metabacillus fastidiosus]|uniref:CopG family transcriptional regulator n=1 Tax=Metabacillus fastidiosus TaxID=1458 RepID=UPI003D265571
MLKCHPGHGGFREDAGRPAIGVTKKISITLPSETWERIEKENRLCLLFFVIFW